MNRSILNIILGLATVSAMTQLHAETATGNASVTIQETLTFTEDQSIAFGAIADTDGTCSMDAAGVLSGTCAGQANGTPGQFTVSGTANQSISVSVGSGSSIDGVNLTPVLNSSAATTLDGSGNALIDVSADLTLASATGGTKALTYILTVNYN